MSWLSEFLKDIRFSKNPRISLYTILTEPIVVEIIIKEIGKELKKITDPKYRYRRYLEWLNRRFRKDALIFWEEKLPDKIDKEYWGKRAGLHIYNSLPVKDRRSFAWGIYTMFHKELYFPKMYLVKKVEDDYAHTRKRTYQDPTTGTFVNEWVVSIRTDRISRNWPEE